MSHIVIVGGGFAGVWSAAGAARARGEEATRITLVAPNEHLVLRPRLYEADPEQAKVELGRILGPIGVTHLRATVTAVDTAARTVTAGGEVIGYDRLVLATGSRLVRPDLPGAEHLFDVDTLEGARRLAAHLRGREGFTAVVVGAGFAGIEVATELASRGRVVLVERAEVVGPDLGPGPRPDIEAALDELGVERRLGATVTEVGQKHARLSTGELIETDTVIWTAGIRASELTTQVPAARDELGRLEVDRFLRVDGAVFAAGDTAAARYDADHYVMQSCQHAVPLGMVAGYNASAELLGLPMREFVAGPYVTCLDLGAAGALFARGWDRAVVASGAKGKEIKQWIMRLIHPPVDDAAAIMGAADHYTFDLPF
ncbi:NAD(P)/FAD-dependent oxidoreductase [Nonomuraea sp. bgisy101]|uniref:NAD(P)/FAD-dependent oxidoreductase n=1 Tax=Nonomuraea sp. bgisy101 TaxID=3413784 RepID=UPI003D732436